MAKTRLAFVCQECGANQSKWSGQCPDCLNWNTLTEQIVSPVPSARTHTFGNYSGETAGQILSLSEIPVENYHRYSTGLSELDRVLGGGLVPGSVVLIGGDPGIGKSTLLLQALANLSLHQPVLYVTGEESLKQVSLRAKRMDISAPQLSLLCETRVEAVLHHLQTVKPQVVVIDSIQTLYLEQISSAPGSVSQIRESAARLVQQAKQSHTAIFLVGHVTKEGQLAGPRVLEHMVDTVLYFEGDAHQRFRLVRAAKNRFGAVNELGIFAMTEKGLKEVANPSAIFLSRYLEGVSGNVVLVSWEGSRPMLVELQALVDQSHLANPRRIAVGIDHQRLAMLLAVLHRHGGLATYDQDVFLNIVGGVKIDETAIDLALLLAVTSSLKNRPLIPHLVAFGEVGLAGEIRPVLNGQERLKEAAKHGFKKAIVPKANEPKMPIEGIEIISVQRLTDALQMAFC